MDPFAAALALLPQKYVPALEPYARYHPEELRLRVGQAPALSYGFSEHPVSAPKLEEEDLVRVLQKATGASLYSAAESMRKGYFSTGTLRLGVCGRASVQEHGTGYSRYSSISVRLARELPDVCKEAACELYGDGFVNTLILSPPGGGKTTALRDLIRILADGGTRVGVIDERGELDEKLYDLGRCSDVISGTDKLSGALLLLRSMTPQVIAADEISAPQDIAAIREIYGCGTGIVATAHACGTEDLKRRESYRELLRCGVFRKALIIRAVRGKRRYEVKELTG